MLSEQRHEMILKLLEEKRSVTVTELTRLLDISESTARRDIVLLDKAGRLVKVFGGAVLADTTYMPSEPTVTQKAEVNRDAKMQIAKYAASLIEPQDFVYLDAGTTTGYMLKYIEETGATFVTNAVAHAQRLAAKGEHVLLVGGTLKSTTEAVVGTTAALMLKDYHFTKGFFGTNGVSRTAGFTTPDTNEALVKKTALEQCRTAYVLCDNSKFNVISSVTFAPLAAGMILTEQKPEGFEENENMIVCMKDTAE
ncbi:MAG: DeoR/GlpR family DNA-binding transcription regulator [Eubacterium sp.]|nr:DeoR/GlpR family DNA-binding transcription regulator [Eubacterium sp.]